ncbi:type VI secretion system baseplate subunit TssG [Pedobacter lithocola]|uniref:Type VI secretion system baseplate subunit TssG n=1 Tax=Pedobacter lithocola TaxID=1908239 RepID=A0ABV8PE96_9SPHI
MKKKSLISNELFTDYKAVVIGADLVERGEVDIENIELMPIGGDKRAFSKDLNEGYYYYSNNRSVSRYRLEVNRESLYDMLPEGLFHSPPKGSSSLDEEGMIQDIIDRRAEEKDARLFFSPFDLELNHIRLISEIYENRLDKRTTYNELNQIFQLGWHEFNLLNKEQSIIWMHLLPEINQKRNDLVFISNVLSALFNLPFLLQDVTHQVKPVTIEKEHLFILGQGSLGIDSIIGQNFIPENDRLLVEIGPASAHEVISLMPGKHQRKILDMALDYLIPVDTEIEISFVHSSANQPSILSEESPDVYLGYTVYL